MKAMFHYARFDHVNRHVWIVDNDAGGMTVTNDAENVTKYLHSQYPDHRFFYLGTDKVWAELVHDSGLFKDFRSLNTFDLGRCPKVN